MTDIVDLPDDATEVVDVAIRRADLVKAPASGMPFFIAKSLAPGEVSKADLSTADLDDKPDSDFAYIEAGGLKDDTGKTVPRDKRHFYLGDAAHVRDALSRAPQSPFGDQAMPKIEAAAEKFGVNVSDDVTKSDADDTLDGSIAAPKLGDERPADAPGDPDDPGSAAWEAVDAANARAAVNSLVSLKQLVNDLSCREANEAFNGDDPEDGQNAYDLDEVSAALDFALAVLAPFAVTEQAEADERAEDALVKTASITATAADVIAKAGRVLSANNEAAIRAAVESLSKVLESLPKAEEADMTKTAETVEAPDDVTKAATATEEQDTAKPDPIAKADDLSSLSDDDLRRLAIQGEDGQRSAALAEIGLRVLTGGGDVPDAKAEDIVPDDTKDPADIDPNDAGETATAAGDVSKSEDPIAKGLADLKADFEGLAKENGELRDGLAKAEAEIRRIGDQPAPSGVHVNGKTPLPLEQLRGQDQDAAHAAAVEIAKDLGPDERQAILSQSLRDRYTQR